MDCKLHPYKLAALAAALCRPVAIGPAHGSSSIVSISSHASNMQTLRSRRKLPTAGLPQPAVCMLASRPRAAVGRRLPSCARISCCTAGDRAARAREHVAQGHLFFAYWRGEVSTATERAGDVAREWSHTALPTRKSDRDLASGLRE